MGAGQKQRIAFDEHLRLILTLLRQFHKGGNEKEKKSLYHRAQQYITTACVFKMQRRVNSGKARTIKARCGPGKEEDKGMPPIFGGRNLYDFILEGPPQQAVTKQDTVDFSLSSEARSCIVGLRCVEAEPKEPLLFSTRLDEGVSVLLWPSV